jgi:hypothetical protein
VEVEQLLEQMKFAVFEGFEALAAGGNFKFKS